MLSLCEETSYTQVIRIDDLYIAACVIHPGRDVDDDERLTDAVLWRLNEIHVSVLSFRGNTLDKVIEIRTSLYSACVLCYEDTMDEERLT